MSTPRKYYAASSTYHKILFIGDGYAEGYGDSVVLGGTCGCSKHVSAALAKKKLGNRLQWECFNQAFTPTASEDWVPSCPENRLQLSWLYRLLFFLRYPFRVNASQKNNLWNRIVMDAKFVDAEVIVLCLGSQDFHRGSKPGNLDFTVDNLMEIAVALATMGKHVHVSTIPMPIDFGHGAYLVNKGCNTLLKERLKKYENKTVGDKEGTIKIGLEFDHFSFYSEDFFAYDGVHLNAQGFKKAAKLLPEIITPSIKKLNLHIGNRLGERKHLTKQFNKKIE